MIILLVSIIIAATSGGVSVAFGVLAGLLTYIGFQMVYNKFPLGEKNIELLIPFLAVTSSVLIIMSIGFFGSFGR